MKLLSDVSTDFQQKGHRALLVTLLVIILSSPFLQQHRTFGWLLAIFLLLMLSTAVRTVAGNARQYRIVMVLGVVALVPQFGVLIERSEWLDALRYGAMTLFLFWVCGLLLRDIIMRSNSVTLELILGAVNVYLMAGIGFAFAYGLIEHLQPGSFTGLEQQLNAAVDVLPFLYFSFVTLTTLGYGDITPLTSFATTASYLEAIFGQLYLAIMVARLVGLYIAKSVQAGDGN